MICKLNDLLICIDPIKVNCAHCDVYNDLSQEELDETVTLTGHDRLKLALQFCKEKDDE